MMEGSSNGRNREGSYVRGRANAATRPLTVPRGPEGIRRSFIRAVEIGAQGLVWIVYWFKYTVSRHKRCAPSGCLECCSGPWLQGRSLGFSGPTVV